jgi:hypothetical protein
MRAVSTEAGMKGLMIHSMEVSGNLIEASEGTMRTVIDDP